MDRRVLMAWLCLSGCNAALAQPAETTAGAMQLYDVTIETSMPHLDEALRYATRREQRCVDLSDLAGAFPVLKDVALQDCRLAPREQQVDGATYALECTAGHGTSGEARWTFDERRIAGTLSVKLGGKNMTFSQRISGLLVGACPQTGRR